MKGPFSGRAVTVPHQWRYVLDGGQLAPCWWAGTRREQQDGGVPGTPTPHRLSLCAFVFVPGRRGAGPRHHPCPFVALSAECLPAPGPVVPTGPAAAELGGGGGGNAT